MKSFSREIRSALVRCAVLPAVALCVLCGANAQTPAPVLIPNTMSTVAGNVNALQAGAAAPFGYTADGMAATSATLDYPSFVAVDPKGELYFLDSENALIRQVDDSGILRTVAGTAPPAGCAPTTSGTYGAIYSGTLNGTVYTNAPFCWNSGTSKMGTVTSYGNAAHNVAGMAATSSGFAIGYSAKPLSGPSFDSLGNMYISENETGFYGVSVVYRGGATLAAFLKTLYPTLTITPGNAYVLTGTTSSSYTVSGTAALKADFKNPGAVGVDAQGNVYIPDEGGFLNVLNIQTTPIVVAGTTIQPGTVSTILGLSCVASSGCTATSPINNTLANAATNGAYYPDVMVVDRWGNLYFNNKATGSGVAMVVAIYAGAPNAVTGAANPLYGMLDAIYPALGVPTQNATYILTGNGAITPTSSTTYNWLISAPNTTLGGTSSGFNDGNIQAIAVDPAGNVYFTDSNRSLVWRIDVVTGETSLMAGGSAAYTTASPTNATPPTCTNNAATHATSYLGDGCETTGIREGGGNYGLALDPAGNLYMTQSTPSDVVEKLSIGTSFPVTAVGSTSAAQRIRMHFYANNIYATTNAFTIAALNAAEFSFSVTPTPASVCVKNTNDVSYDCVLTVVFKPAGTGLRTAELIATDAGGHTHNFRLTGMGTGAQVTLDADQGTTVTTGLTTAAGVAVDGAGTVYTTDSAANVLYQAKAGAAATAFVGTGLSSPAQAAVDAAGNVYVADTGNNRIAMVTPQGTVSIVSLQLANITPSTLSGPQGVAVDSVGNLYIADTGNARILFQPANGQYETQQIATTFTSPSVTLSKPVSLAVDPSGNLYVADTGLNAVVEFPQAFQGLYSVESNTIAPPVVYSGGVKQPLGVVVDPAGSVYVADGSTNTVYVFQAGGTTATTLIASGLTTPSALALDSASNLYVADTGNNRVFQEYRGSQTLAMGPVGIGTTSPLYPIAVGSYGTVAATLTNFAVSSPFTSVNTGTAQCGSTTQLSVGGYCTAEVDFTPTTPGPATGTVQATDNALSSPQTITLTATALVRQSQTITCGTLGPLTYGQGPINLSGTNVSGHCSTTSGLPLTYTVTSGATVGSVSGTTLSILTAGTIVLQVSQAGSPAYLPANPVSLTIVVNKATLTFSANCITGGTGVIPPLTYMVTGYVNGDTSSTAFTGAPSITTTATASSPAGMYPITITQGTLASSNYAFAFTNCTLTLQGTGQTITFNAIPAPVTYGVAPIPLTATSTSGLTVQFSITSGGAYGSINGNVLTVTGAGTIVIAASQPGNYNATTNSGYASAQTVSQTIVVAAAPLTVTANSYTRMYGTANPSPLGPTTVNGLNGDVFPEGNTTTATAATGVGTYAIVPTITSSGTANVANYVVTYVNGSLTITQETSSLVLTEPANPVTSGAQVTLTATLSIQGGTTTAPGVFTFYANSVSVGTVPVTAGATSAVFKYTPAAAAESFTATYTGDPNVVMSTSNAVAVQVMSATTTSLASTNMTPGTGQSFMLQATVVSTLSGASTATGMVTFYNGTTVVGVVNPLPSNGLANLTLSFSTPGVLALTAVYSGDTLHATSTGSLVQTSKIIPVVVGTPTFEISLSPLTLGVVQVPNNVSVAPFPVPSPPIPCAVPYPATGLNGSYYIPYCTILANSVTGKAGSVFEQLISLQSYFGLADVVKMTCTGLPANAACIFSPPSTTLQPTASGQQVLLSIDTEEKMTVAARSGSARGEAISAAALLGALGLLCGTARRRRSFIGRLMTLIVAITLGAGTMGMTSCSSSSSEQVSTAGTYQVVITATDGTVVQTATINLTLQ